MGFFFAGGLVLVVMHRGLTRIAYRSPAVARILRGTPVELVRDGQWVEPTLSRHALAITARERGWDGYSQNCPF